MRRGAVLEEEDALPDAELEPAVADRDRQLRLGQRTLDVRRHVVGPLVVVAVEAHILRHDPAQKGVEVVAHVGRRIFLDQERGRGVLDVDGKQTASRGFGVRPNRAISAVISLISRGLVSIERRV